MSMLNGQTNETQSCRILNTAAPDKIAKDWSSSTIRDTVEVQADPGLPHSEDSCRQTLTDNQTQLSSKDAHTPRLWHGEGVSVLGSTMQCLDMRTAKRIIDRAQHNSELTDVKVELFPGSLKSF